MPKKNENFNQELAGFLRACGFKKISFLDTDGESVPEAENADQFKFHYQKGDVDYGTVTITTHGGKVTVYYNESVVGGPGGDIDSSWTKFLIKLKDWSLRNGQMGFSVKNIDNLDSEMKKHKQQKKEENLLESYYGNKHTSYNDSTPRIKMIIKHNRTIGEGDQRYRYIEKIFLENLDGERILVPSKKPSVGRAFARHLAEGGKHNDDRWNHIKEISEDIIKLSGFVRAVRGGVFNEGAGRVVEEVAEHYNKLRETIKRISGSRGYNGYFEDWKPQLMEVGDVVDYAGMFTQKRLDHRIENALPVLGKLNIKINEINEVSQFESWANSIVEGLSPEMDKKVDDLVTMLKSGDPIPVGPGAMDIKGQIEDIIVDDEHRDSLFSELESLATADPNNDSKETIISWLRKHRDEEFYGDVLDKMDKNSGDVGNVEIAQAPKQQKQNSQPASGAGGTAPQDMAAVQQLMPPPLAERAKKPVQRNFVAKHAQRSGAGAHGKKGFQRHSKHKKKLGEEDAKEISWIALDSGLSFDDKMSIFEEYYVNNNSLTESVDEDKKSYFISLFDMSDIPIKKKKYIVVPLSLIDNRVLKLDKPSYMTYIGKTRNQLIFSSSRGEFRYPSEIMRDLSIFNTFTFSTSEGYNKFKVALLLKFDVELPEMTLTKQQNAMEVKGTLWRVHQSEATGRYHVIKGYNKDIKMFKNKMGAGDFNSKEAAQKKVDELNQSVAEGLPGGFSASDYMPGARISKADTEKTYKFTVATNAIGGAKEHRVKVDATSKNNALNKAVDYFINKGLKPRVDFDGLRVVESVAEMDKSAPQPGRDGKVSHSTYGSRDRDDKDDYFKGKESPGKAITVKQAQKDALDILKKQGVAEDQLGEFAPGSGGGKDDILKTLASNWYHGNMASGDLNSDIQSQEQVERRLEKGVVCPDGVKRKLYIDYSDDYEGVTIYSDDDWSITYKHDDLSESKTNESLNDIKRLSGLK